MCLEEQRVGGHVLNHKIIVFLIEKVGKIIVFLIEKVGKIIVFLIEKVDSALQFKSETNV
jgi:hypothetical protein